MGHFLDASSFYFKARLSAEKPSTWKWFFVLFQITLIFTTKVFCTKPRFERQFWNSEMAYFPHRAITVEFWGNWGWFFENERKKDRRRYTRKPAVSLLIGSVNLVVVADCLVFRLLIFHFKFYSLTTLKSNIFSSFHNF